ncbi:hypothetical protein LUZ63_005217 [Rhynchospora breviuscula]|uniref:Phytocyanin domain-containing protein n=1 Tax=Rhynchospora breviuscula TaxID=2022672 RepID=A0A9Q0HSU3_9POAL|nr:hypothetical protein LUZ63_005217 [Rhynchospora breviuscula]
MKIIVIFVLFVLCCRGNAGALIQVGGVGEGWRIPTDPDAYNRWASGMEFHVGDTLVFNCTNDSYLVVTEKDYESCNVSNPISTNVCETYYKLKELGAMYFISGTIDNCEKGQKMMVQVLLTSASTYPPPSPVPNFDVPIVDGPPTQVIVIYRVVRAHRRDRFSNFGSQVELGKWAAVA